MQEDIKYIFELMKERWRCLRYSIKLHRIENYDKIQIRYYTLHNMLLEVDELLDQQRNGIKSVYEEDIDNINTLPFTLKCLAKINLHINIKFDISKIQYGNDV